MIRQFFRELFCFHKWKSNKKDYIGEGLSIRYPPWTQSIRMVNREKSYRFFQICEKCDKQRNFIMKESERTFQI